MAYNLASPNGIAEPLDLSDLSGWFSRELRQIPNQSERNTLASVAQDLDTFIRWPSEALLLWPGCDRIRPKDEKAKYHLYPAPMRQMLESKGIKPNTLSNGPAHAAFFLAGGERPQRFGSANAWSIHHLYSGKYPYCGRTNTIHAVELGAHFSQSAGLAAMHPIADAMVDEFPFFAWLLRGHTFLRLGYDPDGVFSSNIDSLGFEVGRPCRVIDVSGTDEVRAAE